MDSKPTPSADRMVRVPRSLRSLGTRSTSSAGARQLGAAHAAQSLRAGIGVGLSRRLDDADAVEQAPWGVWHRDGSGTPVPAPHGNAALARYAEALRRRRGGDQPAPARGLPLTLRRAGGTAAGPATGPGGLVRSLVPVDRPERPEIAAILRAGRPPGAQPMPLAMPPSRPERRRS